MSGTYVTGDTQKLQGVINDAENLASKLKSLESELASAINNINSAPGMGTYVTPVDVGISSQVFDTAPIEAIEMTVAQQLEQLENYDSGAVETTGKGNWLGNLTGGATDGFLGVFEGLGDGVVSFVGWLAPKDSGLEKACSSFVEKDLSGAAGAFVGNALSGGKGYDANSGWAKVGKVAGEIGGYVVLGNGASSLGGKILGKVGKAQKIMSSTSKVSRFGKFAAKTAADATIGGVSTGGTAVETALKDGNTFDDAIKIGVAEGKDAAKTIAIADAGFAVAGKIAKTGLSATKAAGKKVAGSKAAQKASSAFKTGTKKVGGTKTAQKIASAAKNAKKKVGESFIGKAGNAAKAAGKKASGSFVGKVAKAGVKTGAKVGKAYVKGIAKHPGLATVAVSKSIKSNFPANNSIPNNVYDDLNVPSSDNGNSSGGSASNPSSGGGSSYSGGSYSGGGGGSYAGSTGNSSTQFRKEREATEKKETKKDTQPAKNTIKESVTSSKEPIDSTKIANTTPTSPTQTASTQKTPTGNTNTQTGTTTPSSTSSTTPTNQSSTNTPITTHSSNNGGGSTGATQHTGGGYSGTSGYTADTGTNTLTDFPETSDGSTLGDSLTEATTSIDDIIKGSKYTKIPTSTKPINTTSSSGSAVIPMAAGLSAAAAAGIGAKVYMDHKKNNENDEYDDIDTEEWSGEDTLDLDYDDSSDTSEVLDDDDAYGYQIEEAGSYDARNNEELVDLQ